MPGTLSEGIEMAWNHPQVRNVSLSVDRKALPWDQGDERPTAFTQTALASPVGRSYCLEVGCLQAISQGLTAVVTVSNVAWDVGSQGPPAGCGLEPLPRLSCSALAPTA
jgi:hypothetical protein